LAVARAAAKAGTLYGLSTASTYSIEQVAAASNAPKLFQLYVCRDRELTHRLVERAKRSGYVALCVTVDTPVVGKDERALRTGMFGPLHRWPLSTVMGFARHPWWVMRMMGARRFPLANFETADGKPAPAEVFAQQLDPSATWKDIREIADWWNGPLAVKGVMSPVDAQCAVDAGASAVIVSNHGGRQLDGAISSIEALPAIVRAVGSRAEVILDSGIRRGVHVLKALASGARACSVGRPYLYGLSAGGEAGVTKALSILRAELVCAMQLSGCPDIAAIDATLIQDARNRGIEGDIHVW
jgi:L-lactate dehydrogenase (cytochrome)